ncbi:hypothetical protein [Paraburkholderia bannensis]|uniref:hypothetical protein n=1 Tax=Paraburkholderia bannensis TaxID=765414 RepID=UPI0012EBD0C6|nr:hypothetical protein [Paraburkholderia bannensis]
MFESLKRRIARPADYKFIEIFVYTLTAQCFIYEIGKIETRKDAQRSIASITRNIESGKKKTSAFAQAEVEVGLETSVVHRLNNAGKS